MYPQEPGTSFHEPYRMSSDNTGVFHCIVHGAQPVVIQFLQVKSTVTEIQVIDVSLCKQAIFPFFFVCLFQQDESLCRQTIFAPFFFCFNKTANSVSHDVAHRINEGNPDS